MKGVFVYFIYLVVSWGFFRYFVRLPDVIEELWWKPLIWLLPLFWWRVSMREKLALFGGGWIKSLIWGGLVGGFYYFVLKFGQWGGVRLEGDAIGVAFATAVTEELVFSGFLAGMLEKKKQGRVMNAVTVGLMAAISRLPILIFVHQAETGVMIGVFLFALASGVIHALIRVKSGNVAGSILARMILNVSV